MYYVAIFVLGLLVGSFINAWVWRVKNHKSIVKGRSSCPNCSHKLNNIDLIPVLSYILLKGKCRHCKQKISIQYPLVEIATASIYMLLLWHFGFNSIQNVVNLIIWCIVSIFVIAAFLYDLDYMQLPDRFMMPAIILAAGLLVYNSTVVGLQTVWPQLLATAIFAGIYFGLWLSSKGKFLGGGDIRVAVAMGLLLTVPQLLVAIFVAYLAGAMVGLVLIATKNKKRTDKVALAPFLIGGLYFGLFFGTQLSNWYLNFFKL